MTVLLQAQIAVFSLLFLLLAIGFLYKATPKTIKEYALGSSQVSTPVLMAAVVAALIGGLGIIGESAGSYKNGLWYLLASLAIPVGCCIMSLVIIPKLSRYYGCLSVVEIMGKMYGNSARKIIGVFAFLFCSAMFGMNIKFFHWIMQSIFVDHALLATAIGISAIILCSTIGGVASVIKTGVIQFFAAIIIIPLVTNHIVQSSGGISQITTGFSDIARPFFYNGTVASFIALTLFCLLPNPSPVYFHRLLVGMDCKKNQAATYALAVVYLLITVFVGCVAFIAIAKFPNIKPHDTLFFVLNNLITQSWIIAAFKIALLALLVSAANSLINTGSIILTHDVLANRITEERKITLARFITVLSGAIGVAFACIFPQTLDIAIFASEYYFVVATIPFIGGLFVKETRPELFWSSAIMGFITFTLARWLHDIVWYEAFLVGFVSSLITYLFMFFMLRDNTSSETSFSIRDICNRIIEKHAVRLNHLSWFILAFFLSSVFLKGRNSSQYGSITYLECITGLLGFALLFIDKSTLKYKNVIALFVLWYCFAFSPAYIFLNSPAHVFLYQEADNFFMINFFGSMVLLAGLFSWDVFLTSVLSGNVIAILAFYAFGPEGKNLIAPVMNLSLLIGLVSVIGAVAFRNREVGISEFIENKLRASNNLDKAIIEADMYNKVLHEAKAYIAASDKYKNATQILGATALISFDELKENILAYFQRMCGEKKTNLIMVNPRHKTLTTDLSTSLFYKITYSLILNVLNCSYNEEVQIRFRCGTKGEVESLEISHGKYKVGERVKHFTPFYPENILPWKTLTMLLEALGAKVTEATQKLNVTFIAEQPARNTSNIIRLKSLRTKLETI